MSQLSLECIVFKDDSDRAILQRCVDVWEDERIDGHVILKLEDPPIRSRDALYIAIPFSADGKVCSFDGIDRDKQAIFRNVYLWGGHKNHVTLQPHIRWPRIPTPPWPNIHIRIADGKIVDEGSQVEVLV